MLKRLGSVGAGVAVAVAIATGGAGAPAAFAKSCPSGYTRATIDGSQKCLRAGEYCDRSDQNEYRHYHYTCKDVNGTYRLKRS
jgi:hypothetical protein